MSLRWKCHRATTFAVVTALSGNLFAGLISAWASHLPDKIEYVLLRSASLRGKYHRTYTHWLLMHIAIMLVLYTYMSINDIMLVSLSSLKDSTFIDMIFSLSLYTSLGCVMHVLEDAPCGQVPVFLPKSKITICPRLFKVGSVSETIFTAVVIALCAVYAFNINVVQILNYI